MVDGLNFTTHQYINPFEGLQKGVTNLQGVLGGQQDALERQKALDLEAARQKVLDDRYQAGLDLTAKNKLEADTQNKLNAEALRGTLGNVGKQDIMGDYNKIPMVNGAISQADTDKLVAKFNAGTYTTPVNTAGLDIAGLSAVNNANIQEQNRLLAADALNYGRNRDTLADARNARLDAISARTAANQNELFNRGTKDYNEQNLYNAGLVKNAGMQVEANPELQNSIAARGGMTLPPDVAKAYDNIAQKGAKASPEDIAKTQQYEAIANDVYAKRPANIGEISDITAKQFGGTNAYANLEAIRQKMGTETATAANKAAMAKERTELLIAGAKSGVTGEGTSGHTGKIDTNPTKGLYDIQQYTDKNPAPRVVKELATELQGQGYNSNQIANIVSASMKTTDSFAGFGGGTTIDQDKVAAAKVAAGTPLNTEKVVTQNKAMADRIAEIDRALGTGKSSFNDYTKKMESLQNKSTSAPKEKIVEATTSVKSGNTDMPVKSLSKEYVYDKGHGRTGKVATIDELPSTIRSELIRNKYDTPSEVNKLNAIDDVKELRNIIDNTPLTGVGSPLHALAANKLNTYNTDRLKYIESKYGRDLYIPGSSAYAISPAELKKFGNEYDKKYKAEINR